VRPALVFLLLVSGHAVMSIGMRYPTVVYDELVYTGFARYFSGAAPMANLFQGVYGHFGYSLLLAPIFLVKAAFQWHYHAILLLNSILMASMYFPLCGLLRRFSNGQVAVVAAVASLYPSYLLFSNFVLSENLFVPLYLVVAWLFVRFLEQHSNARAAALGISTPMLYVVHTRGMGVVICAVVIVLWQARRQKIPWTAALLVTALAAAGVIAMEAAKVGIDRWTPDIAFQDRSLALRIHTINDIKLILLALTGQILYLIQATFGLYVLGLVYLVRKLSSDRGVVAFLLSSHVAVLLGSAYFIGRQLPLTRLDLLYLGRYNEGVLAPIMAAGLLLAWESRHWLQRAAAATVALTMAGVVFLSRYTEVSVWSLLTGQLHVNAIGLLGPAFLLPRREVELLCIASALVLIIYAAVAWYRPLAASLLVAALFATCAWAAYSNGIVIPTRELTAFDTNAHTPARLDPILDRLPDGDIGYDAASWDSFTFAQYQLYHPGLHFRVFDSRAGESPCCSLAIAGPRWNAPGFTAVGTEIHSDDTLWVRAPGLVRQLAGLQSYIAMELGNRPIPGIVTGGIYPEERVDGDDFRWTNGHASITVPLRPGNPPSHLDLLIGAVAPTTATIRLNGAVIADQKLDAGSNPIKRRVSLPAGAASLTLTIDSPTFIPPGAGAFTRTLGVQIREFRIFR